LRVARLFYLLRGSAPKALVVRATRSELHDYGERDEANAGLKFQCAKPTLGILSESVVVRAQKNWPRLARRLGINLTSWRAVVARLASK
jgi:hypothetical protein